MTLKQLQAKFPTATSKTWHKHKNGGGWVENTAYVDETAYVGPDALVYGHAAVCGTSKVLDSVEVYGNAALYHYAKILGHAKIYGHAIVSDFSSVRGTSYVYGTAHLKGYCSVQGFAEVYGNAVIVGSVTIRGSAKVYGCYTKIYGSTVISDCACISDTNDYMHFDNVAEWGPLTAFKCADLQWRVVCGCRLFTLEEALEYWANKPDRVKTYKLVKFIESTVC